MNQKILKVITVLMLIATLTMANFMLLCADVVSYAVDAINADKSTNNKNVEFVAYLKNERGEKVNSFDAKTNEENLKLYFQIAVKQEGLFNGNIVLNDANFKFKTDFTDNSISKIEENKIYLNQINAGEIKEIEVGIQLLTDSQFDLGLINKQSKIGIEGIYRDSKQKDISISATKTVEINMVSPYSSAEECINLSQEVITNKVVNYNGEDKRIIQIEVVSGINNNLVPIKSSLIKVQAPKISDKYPEVLISANKVLATNGKNLTQDNWSYNKETGLITIQIENKAEDNKVIWTKNGDDKFVITYIFDKDVKVEGEKISTSSEINLYENTNTVVNASSETQIGKEEKDSVITTEMVQSEANIYKGKLYAGLSRDITYTTVINSNLTGVVSGINIVEENQKIADKNIATTYKNTIVNKENVLNVLGEDGELTIFNNANGTEIARINSGSQTDENGNITVNYDIGISEIKINTTSPKNTGDIKLTTTKTIEKVETSIVKTSTEITSKVVGSVVENKENVGILETDSKIGLIETETKAQLQLNKTDFSTMSTNNVEMRVVLNSRDENNDLYKNPTIRIQLPATVKDVNVKSTQLIDEDELKVTSIKLLDGNVLEIKTQGEQTNYKDKAIEGAILILNMDITLDKKLPSSQEQIVLTCINGEKTVQEQKTVNFVSYAGLVTINRIEDYGIEMINNQGNKETILPINQRTRGTRTTTAENEIINNEENQITNVSILGSFPTKDSVEGNNFDMLVSEISIEGIDASRFKTYYSENANATSDLTNKDNGWTENIVDSKKVKKYLVVADKLDVREGMKIAYDIQLPQDLDYNLTSKQGYEVYYTNVTAKKQVTTDFITLSTEKGATLDVSLKALRGLEDAKTVREGEIIRYAATISNSGSEDITNAKIIAKVPENTVLIDSDKLSSTEQVEGGEEKDDTIELDKADVEFSIDKLAKGESVVKYYEVKVKNGTLGKTIQNSVELQYGDVTKTSNVINLTVEEGQISISLRNSEETTILKNGYSYGYVLKIKNETDKKINNLALNVNEPDGIKVSKMLYIDGNGDAINVEKSNTLTINELNSKETLTIAIDVVVDIQTDIESQDISLIAKVTADGKDYNSNQLDLKIENEIKGLEMEVTSNNSGSYVRAGDKITYNIVVKNNSDNKINNIKIENVLSNEVSLVSVKKNDKELSEEEYNLYKDEDYNYQRVITLEEDEIDVGQSINYSIQVEADLSYNDGEVAQIVNETKLKRSFQTIKTVKIEHILKTEENEDNDDNNGGNGNNGNNGNNSSTSSYMLSGTAWIDENENGQKDSNEKLLEGIKVKLLDAKTNEYVKDSNGNVMETTTNSEGFYAFSKVVTGQYLVIFEYDTTAYGITAFEKEGVPSESNSKVIQKTMTIDGKEVKVGTTEKLDLTKNISGINIGLIPAKKYDMQLDKYVTKITVQNSKTVSQDYDNEKLAKQEINGKEVNSTTVIVEYTIRVTNKGDVAGYVKKIADYLSSDYKFSSELNKDWYQDGTDVYCTSLANTKINPGESKDVKLTVIKQMNESNVGLVNNTAEIVSSYNELGLTDINSTEGNKVKGENDMSSADVIIAIKTGEVVATVVLVITTIIILAVAVIVIKRFILNKGII